MESGEGIERARRESSCRRRSRQWNPVKELKALPERVLTRPRFLVESGEGIESAQSPLKVREDAEWNPVKELKAQQFPHTQIFDRLLFKWNPVKELKDMVFINVDVGVFVPVVESGEGIESCQLDSTWTTSFITSVESGEGIESIPT